MVLEYQDPKVSSVKDEISKMNWDPKQWFGISKMVWDLIKYIGK